VYVCGESLIAIWGGGGSWSSPSGFREGVAGGSAAIFYHLVGERDAIFFSLAVLDERGGRFIHCGLYLFAHCVVTLCAVFP